LVALVLVGCTAIKERLVSKDAPNNPKAAQASFAQAWIDPPLTREGTPLLILATPTPPPEEILHRPIKLELDTGATIRDVVAALASLGYSLIITDREAANAEVLVPRYQGSLGGLLTSLQRASDVWVTWESGALVVSSRERIVMSLPQERRLASRVAEGLSDLGLCINGGAIAAGVSERALASSASSIGQPASTGLSGYAPTTPSATPTALGNAGSGGPTANLNSSNTRSPCGPSSGAATAALSGASRASQAGLGSAASWEAGMVTLVARPSEYRRALTFLERITQNAAVVNLQVAITSVTLNQNANRGIDWSQLQFALNGGHANLLQELSPNSSSTGSGTGTGSNGNGATSPSTGSGNVSTGGATSLTWPNTGVGYLLNDGTFRGVISNAAFSMIGFIDFLDTYGQTKTLQSVMLRTVTGNEVELKSVTQIPYVSGVGVGTTTAAVGSTSSLLGSANTATANDGVILKMAPSFDAASDTVTIDMSLSIEAVLGFNQLSAGNQLGTLTQPTTAERTFNDVIRVRPGQTVVVGGITYDQVERDNNVPLFLPDKTGHETLVVKRQSMFIVIRPTVTLLGALKATGDTPPPLAAHDTPEADGAHAAEVPEEH
jgi:type II secretory pathway component GspD/PulD (secretin)